MYETKLFVSYIYRPICTLEDLAILQSDMDTSWTEHNFLQSVNADKCKGNRQTNLSLEPQPPLQINGVTMERVENYKYLEVWITPNLSWSKHISEACYKARQKVGILYRKCYKNANNASYNAKNILKKVLKLYLSCIRPELEYAATVWSPHQKGRIDTLESVQYEFEFRLQISVAYSYFCHVLTTSQILVMDLHSTEEIAVIHRV